MATILDIINRWLECIRKSAEPVLSLVPRVEALASPNLSKRATPKAPRQCKYIECTLTTNDKTSEANESCI